tara:strand:+ start:545 stop:925 length:381 start_codon:yes stop_codon:yes gene_type:complete
MESSPDFCNIEPTDQSRDYRQELFDKYKDFEEEDYTGLDDFLEDSDKVGLIRFVNEMVEKDYGKYPPVMTDILVKKIYYDTIKNMDKEEYFKEKERDKELSLVEKELLKIKQEKQIVLIEDEIKED